MNKILVSWECAVIRTAAQLGIADILGDETLSAGEVARRGKFHEAATRRLLRAMITVGLAHSVAEDCFALSPQGHCLRRDVPGSLRDTALVILSGDQFESWSELPNSVRTGKCAFQLKHGMPVFEYYTLHSELGERFASVMRGMSFSTIPSLLAAYDFTHCGTIADIGGGEGHLLAAIIDHYPQLNGILFDLPHTAELARHAFATHRAADRLSVQSGDMFRSVPEADTYLLKWILHDWNDEECIAILKNIRRAMRPGGRVLVVDAQRPANDVPSSVHLLDMNMLAQTSGWERSAVEFAKLFEAADLGHTLTLPFPSPFEMSIFEAR